MCFLELKFFFKFAKTAIRQRESYMYIRIHVSDIYILIVTGYEKRCNSVNKLKKFVHQRKHFVQTWKIDTKTEFLSMQFYVYSAKEPMICCGGSS